MLTLVTYETIYMRSLRIISTLVALIYSIGLRAQETVPATDGDATGVQGLTGNDGLVVQPEQLSHKKQPEMMGKAVLLQ